MTLSLKRKSKKYNKRNKCKVTRKKKVRFTRKSLRKKGGMFSPTRSNKKRPQDISILPVPQIKLGILPNQKRSKNENPQFCVIGADYLFSQDYKDIVDYYQKLSRGSKEKKPLKDLFDSFEIENRAGKVRCESGYYTFSELPSPTEQSLTDKLLKFVVVENNETHEAMVLQSYANMLNYDYAEEFFKKWIDRSSSKIFIRKKPKIVVLLTREKISEIEGDSRFTSRLVNGNLLLTKSYYPQTYDAIIYEFFFGKRFDMANTVVVCPTYEIPHSAIAANYNGEKELKTSEDGREVAVYAGLEGVFYHGDPNNTLYFVIGNLSGHYKTPKSRMEFVKTVLEQYGYTNIRIIEDPSPPSPPSSIDSDDSDAPREEYRRFITNDPRITNFEEALARLNAADTTPVQVPVMQGFSQEEEMDI